MRSQVDRIAAIFDGAVVTELDVALDPGFEYEATSDGRIAVTLVKRMGDGWVDLSLPYVATPRLLAPYGVDLDALDSATEFMSVESGELAILGVAQPADAPRRKVEPMTTAETIDRRYTSAPGTFVTPEALRRRGWLTAPSGRWLIESDAPLTIDELASTRDLAAGAGLTIETRDHQAGLAGLRTGRRPSAWFSRLGCSP